MNANQARHVDGRYKLMYRCDACGLPIGDRGCTGRRGLPRWRRAWVLPLFEEEVRRHVLGQDG